MASVDELLTQLTDPSLLDKIDALRELNISEYVPLPQLVVVGDQSSGKSSVLEGLTDLPFPRDNGLCTRFATQIVFRRAEKSSIAISIIPSRAADPKTKEKLRAFKIDHMTSLSGEEFLQILSQACDAMSIPAPGQSLAPGQSTFSDDMLKIELGGPSRQHLSVIDVPGIFRTPTYGVTTKEDMTLVRRMVKSYIKDSRTIILAVIPAPVDIATQEILSMAEEADQLGQRTLGVLTKPDLVDKGGEELVMDLVHGTKNKLNLGYCMVRNRGQQEKALSSTDRRQNERHFFSTSPWSALDKSRVGIPALQDRLRELLVDITRREFPNVKYEIDRRLSDCERPAQDRKRILTQRYRSGGEANGLKVSCRTPKLEERTPQESQIKYKKGQPNELSVRDFPFENDRGCKRAGETAGEKAGPIKQGEEGRRGNMQEIV